MSLTKDRVVIVCVVFKYRGFIGVKGYNIDKDSFIDIFYDSLYLFDILGNSTHFIGGSTQVCTFKKRN